MIGEWDCVCEMVWTHDLDSDRCYRSYRILLVAEDRIINRTNWFRSEGLAWQEHAETVIRMREKARAERDVCS
jgi:hypothetical protein